MAPTSSHTLQIQLRNSASPRLPRDMWSRVCTQQRYWKTLCMYVPTGNLACSHGAAIDSRSDGTRAICTEYVLRRNLTCLSQRQIVACSPRLRERFLRALSQGQACQPRNPWLGLNSCSQSSRQGRIPYSGQGVDSGVWRHEKLRTTRSAPEGVCERKSRVMHARLTRW